MDYYVKPYYRAPPYIFGLLIGIQYVEYYNLIKNKDQENLDKTLL